MEARLRQTSIRTSDRISIVDVKGELTVASEDALTEAYERASEQPSSAVVLSFSGLRRVNAGGVGLLMTLLIRANRERKRLLVYGLSESCSRIFELARLDDAIAVYTSERDALAAAAAYA